jgi:hypothetical protein
MIFDEKVPDSSEDEEQERWQGFSSKFKSQKSLSLFLIIAEVLRDSLIFTDGNHLSN